ncbi:hypothetical protein M5K25_004871 [Dendrobium thyrsiflorum]|uniref:Uncharacterized protein n=1 Tax=Dendrobium thyrsiflorum TaxID=117978 RepID=A0ABD0VN49_DENTH
MMAQMTAMMQMMQRNVAVGPAPTPPVDPPNLQMLQILGIRGIPGNGQGAQNTTRHPTPQNIASTSEPVTAAQVQTSTFTQRPDQASSSKPDKVKSSKRKTRLKKPREKKNATQRVIDSLDEYYQTLRQPIKLANFMSGLKVGEAEEDGDANSLPTEVCRVISVVSSMSVKRKYVKETALESCMVVSPMDYSSEEDLYFP